VALIDNKQISIETSDARRKPNLLET